MTEGAYRVMYNVPQLVEPSHAECCAARLRMTIAVYPLLEEGHGEGCDARREAGPDLNRSHKDCSDRCR